MSIDNNIKFLYNLPYHPHSQSVLVKLNKVRKKGLLDNKEDLKNKFNNNYPFDDL